MSSSPSENFRSEMPEEPLRLLLVDDDDVDRMAVRRVLKGAASQFTVEEAADASTAIRRLRDEQFDCALLDYMLPDEDGLRLLRDIRAAGIRTPIIMLTGQGNEQIAVEMMKAGANDYLSKAHISLERLSRSVMSAVRVHRAEAERSQLLHLEQSARAQTEVAQGRLAFLADASTVLNSSLDYGTTLAAVARLCVPRIADWCTIDVVEGDGNIRRLEMVHPDPDRVRWATELQRRYPLHYGDPQGVGHVIRSGESELYEEISADQLTRAAVDAEHARIVLSLGLNSAMIVPLMARGRTVGAITLISAESKRRYGPADLALAEDLGRRAGVAADNARLYRNAQDAIASKGQAVALLDTLLATAPVGFGFWDREFRFLRVNESLAKINGLPQAAHLGKTIKELLPVIWEEIGEACQRVVEHGEPIIDFEVSGQTPAAPGVTRTWLASFYPVRSPEGEMLGIGGVVSEITERKRFERELREAKDAAVAANQSKDQFLAVLSHELRTPLTPVLMAVQSLEEEKGFHPALASQIAMIRRNVELEARLIDDLLDLTRISRGKLELTMQSLDAHASLRNAVEICAIDIAAKNLTVSIDQKAEEHFVRADSARLQQVFWNLIKNAVKFTGPRGKISISTFNESIAGGSSTLVVEVRDTGIGIEPEVLPRIFDAFEQGEQSITRRFGGLGLGLAISKALIDLHRGSLSAASQGKGMGATFRMTLATVPTPPHVTVKSEPDEDTRASAPADPANGEGLRILMVDDHLDTSMAMKRLLERQGYRVTLANSVSSGLERAQLHQFDLLISDIGLPDGSGLDLMRQLKSAYQLRGIALSGFGMEEDIKKSKEAGFAEHLTKPINFQKLEAIIKSLTENGAK